MKKNKKKLFIILSIIFVVIIASVCLIIFGLKDENKLTLQENKWIDSNKSNVIDVAIINEIPIVSYDGNGLVYDYLDSVTKKHNLSFNVVPYKLDTTNEYTYKLDVVAKPKSNDLILLKDNIVLITLNNDSYTSSNKIENLKIGVLSSDLERVKPYLGNNEYVEYENYSKLKEAFSKAKVDSKENIQSEINAIIILKAIYTKEIVEENYKIAYNFDTLNGYYVLTLAGDKNLNSILTKDYNVFKEEEYENIYNKQLLNNYYNFKNISDIDKKTLESKSYTFGFINYGIYNYINKNEISGMNGLLLKSFKNFSKLSINYTKYSNMNELLKEFNSNKVDFMLDITSNQKYSNEVYNTIGVYNKNLVIVSGINSKSVVNGISSLSGKEVLIVKDTYLEDELLKVNAKVKLYNDIDDLSKDFKDNSISIVDLDTYDFYKGTRFKNAKINYLESSNEKYSFVINDNDSNKVFEDLFDFYLSYTSINNLVYSNYSNITKENNNYTFIYIIIIVLLLLYIIIDFYNHLNILLKNKNKHKKVRLSKSDKMKYIDQLTSLKNRAYLNSKIESWDDSEVYPQAIIVIDLNNISYINDNYGREEGDKVITEAANILIVNQLQNSEIIRTDGNEFLVYLVGYSEKQVIAYLRKINKEFKGLSHGFGAASGYSIIDDGIKTIDDAVNEATLQMKETKESIDY